MIECKIIIYNKDEFESLEKMGISTKPKDLEVDFYFDPREVFAVRQDIDDDGKIVDKWSIIYMKNSDSFVVLIPYERMKEIYREANLKPLEA